MKILISTIAFRDLTGSEMYAYELSRELVISGHDVSIVSTINPRPSCKNEIAERARANGVKVYSFEDPPKEKFDILHVGQYSPSEFALCKYDGDVIATIHSEYPCEKPLVSTRIKKYICIRPSIQEHIIKEYGIPREKTVVIYNPVDTSRFNTVDKDTKDGLVLFVGTVDLLRKDTLLDLKKRFKNLKIIGANESNLDYLGNTEWHDQVWKIEKYIKQASMTAGILLGRTTIESWLCGVPTEIYDIDLDGKIKSHNLVEPPRDLSIFDAKNVAKKIEEQYALIRG